MSAQTAVAVMNPYQGLRPFREVEEYTGRYARPFRLWPSGPDAGQAAAAYRFKPTPEALGAFQYSLLFTRHLKWIVNTGSVLLSPAFGHDGKRIVSGSADRTIPVWDLQPGLSLSAQGLRAT